MKNEIEKLTKQIEALTEEVKRLRESQPLLPTYVVPTYIPYPQPSPVNPAPFAPYISPWVSTCGGVSSTVNSYG